MIVEKNTTILRYLQVHSRKFSSASLYSHFHGFSLLTQGIYNSLCLVGTVPVACLQRHLLAAVLTCHWVTLQMTFKISQINRMGKDGDFCDIPPMHTWNIMKMTVTEAKEKKSLGRTSRCLWSRLNCASIDSLYVVVYKKSSGFSAIIKTSVSLLFEQIWTIWRVKKQFFGYNFLTGRYNLSCFWIGHHFIFLFVLVSCKMRGIQRSTQGKVCPL